MLGRDFPHRSRGRRVGVDRMENGMNNLSRLQVGLMDINITWQISTCLDVAESRLKFV